jgi:hypothetical protein
MHETLGHLWLDEDAGTSLLSIRAGENPTSAMTERVIEVATLVRPYQKGTHKVTALIDRVALITGV